MNAPLRHKPSRRRRARGSGDRRDNSQPRQPPHTRSTRISCETPDLKSHSQRAGGHPRLRRAPQRGSASPRRRSPIGMRESSRAWSSMPFRFPAVTSSPMSIQISAAARTRRPAICRSTRAALGASRRGQRSRALPPSSRHSSIPSKPRSDAFWDPHHATTLNCRSPSWDGREAARRFQLDDLRPLRHGTKARGHRARNVARCQRRAAGPTLSSWFQRAVARADGHRQNGSSTRARLYSSAKR
jgi:hypothetical protein